jgi:hypothetical protein
MKKEKPVPAGAQKIYPTSKMVVRIFDPGKDPKKDPPREVAMYPLSRGNKNHGEQS